MKIRAHANLFIAKTYIYLWIICLLPRHVVEGPHRSSLWSIAIVPIPPLRLSHSNMLPYATIIALALLHVTNAASISSFRALENVKMFADRFIGSDDNNATIFENDVV